MTQKDLHIAKEYVKKFIQKDKPLLVFLTGSRALGWNNKNSDMDLCVVSKVNKKYLRRPIPDFTEIIKYPSEFKGIHFEIEHLTIKELNNSLTNLLDFKLWKFKTAKLLYGKKQDLKKLKLVPNKKEMRLARVYFFYHSKNILKKAKNQLEKKLAISKSSEFLIKLVFMINEKPIPAEKWLLKEYKQLRWKPRGMLTNILKSIDNTDYNPLIKIHKQLGKHLETKKSILTKDPIHTK